VLFLYLHALGTKVDDDSLRIVVGLHLGVPIVAKHTSVCGSKVDSLGTHDLTCRCSSGHDPWHAAVNETTILRALVSGSVPAVSHDHGKRPDSMTLIPWWQAALRLCIYLLKWCSQLANSAESAKVRKYSSLSPSFLLFSIVCGNSWYLRVLIGAADRF